MGATITKQPLNLCFVPSGDMSSSSVMLSECGALLKAAQTGAYTNARRAL
jgi:hypothetical protein